MTAILILLTFQDKAERTRDYPGIFSASQFFYQIYTGNLSQRAACCAGGCEYFGEVFYSWRSSGVKHGCDG